MNGLRLREGARKLPPPIARSGAVQKLDSVREGATSRVLPHSAHGADNLRSGSGAPSWQSGLDRKARRCCPGGGGGGLLAQSQAHCLASQRSRRSHTPSAFRSKTSTSAPTCRVWPGRRRASVQLQQQRVLRFLGGGGGRVIRLGSGLRSGVGPIFGHTSLHLGIAPPPPSLARTHALLGSQRFVGPGLGGQVLQICSDCLSLRSAFKSLRAQPRPKSLHTEGCNCTCSARGATRCASQGRREPLSSVPELVHGGS